MNCEFCQSPAHVWFQCPKKPDGWKPVRLAQSNQAQPSEPLRQIEAGAVAEPDAKSTAAYSNVGVGGAILGFETQAAGVKGNCPAVDTNPSTTNEGPNTDSLSAFATSLAGVEGDKTGTKFNKTAYQKSYMAAWRRGQVGKKYVKA